MTTKRKGHTASAPTTKVGTPERVSSETRARIAVLTEFNAALVMHAFSPVGKLDVNTASQELVSIGNDVIDDKTEGMQRMLISQAHALETMFTHLANQAGGQTGLSQFQAIMSLALRAQNQSRMTLETLAKVKAPAVFVKQANIANGPQQVNNNTARMQGTTNAPNELLEAPHAKPDWMDAGATRTAAPGHHEMEAVEAVNRAAHAGRKDHGQL